jgi:hypothetical protein
MSSAGVAVTEDSQLQTLQSPLPKCWVGCVSKESDRKVSPCDGIERACVVGIPGNITERKCGGVELANQVREHEARNHRPVQDVALWGGWGVHARTVQ